jgi:hypothetical protein
VKRLSGILLPVLAAGCASAIPRSGQVFSIVGSWRYEEAQTGSTPVDHRCATDFGASYLPSGEFVGYDEAGEWRIEDGHLVEIVWEPEISSGLTPRAVKPEVRRFKLEWISPDVVNLRDEAGERSALIRCSEEH